MSVGSISNHSLVSGDTIYSKLGSEIVGFNWCQGDTKRRTSCAFKRPGWSPWMLVVLVSSNQLIKGNEEQVLVGFNLQSIYTHLEAKATGAAQSVLDGTDKAGCEL